MLRGIIVRRPCCACDCIQRGPWQVTFKALLEAFAEAKDAERAAWVLDEMRDFEVSAAFRCCFTWCAVGLILLVGCFFSIRLLLIVCE